MPGKGARELENQVAQRADRPVRCQRLGLCELVPSCHKLLAGTGAAGASCRAMSADQASGGQIDLGGNDGFQ